jgi:hypothetical protein
MRISLRTKCCVTIKNGFSLHYVIHLEFEKQFKILLKYLTEIRASYVLYQHTVYSGQSDKIYRLDLNAL